MRERRGFYGIAKRKALRRRTIAHPCHHVRSAAAYPRRRRRLRQHGIERCHDGAHGELRPVLDVRDGGVLRRRSVRPDLGVRRAVRVVQIETLVAALGSVRVLGRRHVTSLRLRRRVLSGVQRPASENGIRRRSHGQSAGSDGEGLPGRRSHGRDETVLVFQYVYSAVRFPSDPERRTAETRQKTARRDVVRSVLRGVVLPDGGQPGHLRSEQRVQRDLVDDSLRRRRDGKKVLRRRLSPQKVDLPCRVSPVRRGLCGVQVPLRPALLAASRRRQIQKIRRRFDRLYGSVYRDRQRFAPSSVCAADGQNEGRAKDYLNLFVGGVRDLHHSGHESLLVSLPAAAVLSVCLSSDGGDAA